MDINKNDFPEKTIYTVSELNRETKQLLSRYYMTVNVEGEISNLSTPASGHIYFTLKDTNAQIRCAMFRAQQRQRRFKPENGNKVIAKAQVGLYEARGDYQLLIETLEPAGDGALLKAFELLKTKLAEEGLFDRDRKKPLPLSPSMIGVITSTSGAVIHDILSVLQRRYPICQVLIYPVAVQGESAAMEIIQAINVANDRQECDLLILARGGGSLEDLNSFNDESLARIIGTSKIPIISAIGHETDFTIADFVADLRAPTPSAAAEHAVPDTDHWLLKFKQLQNSLIRQVKHQQNEYSTKLKWLEQRLQQKQPKRELQAKAQRLDELQLRLQHHIDNRLQNYHAIVSTQVANLSRHNPSERLIFLDNQQKALAKRLNRIIVDRIKNNHHRLLSTSQTLHAVSPLATLNRGYALVTHVDSMQVISSTHQLVSGDIIKTTLANGQIVSKINEVTHE